MNTVSVGARSTSADSQNNTLMTHQAMTSVDDSTLMRQYDKNLIDSDDSSDEEVLIRTGNVPRHWYDLYDHQGYDVKGLKVGKMEEKDELDQFIER